MFDSQNRRLLVRSRDGSECSLVVEKVKVAGTGKGWVAGREWWNGLAKGGGSERVFVG